MGSPAVYSIGFPTGNKRRRFDQIEACQVPAHGGSLLPLKGPHEAFLPDECRRPHALVPVRLHVSQVDDPHARYLWNKNLTALH